MLVLTVIYSVKSIDRAVARLFLAPSVLPVPEPSIQITGKAQSVMTTDRPSAGRTAPFFLLSAKKLVHPVFADRIQILDHTHMVFVAVALIERLQSLAGIVFAFDAEADQAFADLLTAIGHMQAVLAARDTSGAIGPMEALLIDVQLPRLKSDTQPAIHPARGDQILFVHNASP